MSGKGSDWESMSFVDKVTVSVMAGQGGDGKLSFRREKFIAKGGPDGGDGGNGANVVLRGSRNQNTLAAFRYQKELKAEAGRPGGKSRKHGRSGRDLIVDVPVGTMASTPDGQVVADLFEDQQQAVVAQGGRGGFGNAHFVSSRRQAPNFAEKGEAGQAYELTLELKMIADIGLVGLPNAGKSTLLSKISNARPEIADYAFTTVRPNLGVVDIDDASSLLVADIPGLIEGAAEGKGLGHDFLRHVERTAVILHLIDAYNDDVAAAYRTIRRELKAYSDDLSRRPEVVALTKVEGLDEEIVADLINQLKRAVPAGTALHAISSQSGFGLKTLLFGLKEIVLAERTRPMADPVQGPDLPVIQLEDTSAKWQVEKIEGGYRISGDRIEQFARRTDFNNQEALQRLRDILRRYGVMHELNRRGLAPGDTIFIGENKFSF